MKITLIEKMPKSFVGGLIIPLFKPKDIEENILFKNLPREDQTYLKKVVASVKWDEKELRLVSLPSNPIQGVIFWVWVKEKNGKSEDWFWLLGKPLNF